MKTSYTGYENPILGENAEEIYTDVYGEAGKNFPTILESSPKEMAVVSRLLMYLQNKL